MHEDPRVHAPPVRSLHGSVSSEKITHDIGFLELIVNYNDWPAPLFKQGNHPVGNRNDSFGIRRANRHSPVI